MRRINRLQMLQNRNFVLQRAMRADLEGDVGMISIAWSANAPATDVAVAYIKSRHNHTVPLDPYPSFPVT